ncbi:SMI1/KNR4 family protein [Herbaspirillum sp. CF444]|uniref:SMI1/KNR4 family protein n=1 Tax=Herbaspirillum sp. CF444 TaxID=1144319 RepID=UPI000558B0B6|nr:SMI1/KNR4 family protein [Herbaspirillum sp. CF444]
MDFSQIVGKVFRAQSGEEFGTIRALGEGPLPNWLGTIKQVPFAIDDSGNFFVRDNQSIYFLDHETDELTVLAISEADFLAGLCSPQPVELTKGQVKSAWINPEFLKKISK